MNPKPMLRAVRTVVALVLALPLSATVTILLLPFWSWLEATTGFEALGHSGPAVWCYLLVFSVVAACAAPAFILRRRARACGGSSVSGPW